MKLARRAGSTSARRVLVRSRSARRAHDERSSCARRAGLMSWLSGHLNGVILQTFTKLLVERSSSARRAGSTSARRASSSSQLHRVNGVLADRSSPYFFTNVGVTVADNAVHRLSISLSFREIFAIKLYLGGSKCTYRTLLLVDQSSPDVFIWTRDELMSKH